MFGDLVNMLTTVTPRIAYVADALSPAASSARTGT